LGRFYKMVAPNITTTLIRLGIFNEDLEERLSKFSNNFYIGSIDHGTIANHILFNQNEVYSLIISQKKIRLYLPGEHNLILSVTSYSDNQNQQIYDEFSEKIGINLDIPVPEI